MKSKLYTRRGDDGTTSLVGGTRVLKDSPRLQAYGTVDELNSWLGLLAASDAITDDTRSTLRSIQHRLFDIGAASYLDLRDSELALTRSRLAYFQAVYNYLIAGAELELLLGNAVDASTVPVPDRSKFK